MVMITVITVALIIGRGQSLTLIHVNRNRLGQIFFSSEFAANFMARF